TGPSANTMLRSMQSYTIYDFIEATAKRAAAAAPTARHFNASKWNAFLLAELLLEAELRGHPSLEAELRGHPSLEAELRGHPSRGWPRRPRLLTRQARALEDGSARESQPGSLSHASDSEGRLA